MANDEWPLSRDLNPLDYHVWSFMDVQMSSDVTQSIISCINTVVDWWQ